ncbi:MAG: chromate efflux transporter [Armatimonadota bacterium]|nr:chromate efflux transporter [Armatimonadota bacterium]
MPDAAATLPPGKAASLPSLALFFLRLGFTAFGGPAAHIAMMEDELVRRRGWLTRDRFLDLLGAANLIPGPSSTELAIYIGYVQAGWLGLLLAGGCFVLPAAVMVGAIAWVYVHFGHLPQVTGLLYGVKPVIVAIIVQAISRLVRTAIKTRLLGAVAAIAAAVAAAGIGPLYVLLGAGAALGTLKWGQGERPRRVTPLLTMASVAAVLIGVPLAIGLLAGVNGRFDLTRLFFVFLKLGSVVYGSGYVLLAFLRDELVVHRHWLLNAQILDAVAVGQVTPGPVFTTATFLGYLLGGFPGALIATGAIFLPAFLLVFGSGRLIPRLRRSPVAAAFMDGINSASVALMAVVTWQLAVSAVVDPVTALLAATSAAVLLRYRVNSVWLILAGAIVGLLSSSGFRMW